MHNDDLLEVPALTINNSLTPEEVAALLRIKKNTVYELIKRGKLQAYRVGRKYRIERAAVEAYKKGAYSLPRHLETGSSSGEPPTGEQFDAASFSAPVSPLLRSEPDTDKLIICGLDIMLDILAKYLEKAYAGRVSVYRKHEGSFKGLDAMYHQEADMAGIHLWDSEGDSYNVSYVKRLLPGIPVAIVHLAKRWQGFYVKAGNPLAINDWTDLARNDVRFVNREPGCGSRVLLDEKIISLHLDRYSINGYDRVEFSHLAVASAVARGSADAGLGIQKACLQVRDVDFVPLHQEDYELAVLGDKRHGQCLDLILEILHSAAFKEQIEGLGDYDLSDLGVLKALSVPDGYKC